MRIVHLPTGREAKPRKGVYKCFPKNSNVVPDERVFDTVEEAALFPLKNPEWNIWVAANGSHHDGQVKHGIVIEGSFDMDDLRSRGLI